MRPQENESFLDTTQFPIGAEEITDQLNSNSVTSAALSCMKTLNLIPNPPRGRESQMSQKHRSGTETEIRSGLVTHFRSTITSLDDPWLSKESDDLRGEADLLFVSQGLS